MYRLTAVSPPDMTERVLALLQEEPDINQIATTPANVGDTNKDIVTAFVRRQAIDIVVERLRTLRE